MGSSPASGILSDTGVERRSPQIGLKEDVGQRMGAAGQAQECGAGTQRGRAGKLGGSGQRGEMPDIHGQRRKQLLVKTSIGQWLPAFTAHQKPLG